MTIRRRKGKARARELTLYQVMAIRHGYNWSDAFASDDDWRAGYWEHRDELVDEAARIRPGHRPESFWVIEIGQRPLLEGTCRERERAAGDGHGYDWSERVAARAAVRAAFESARMRYLAEHGLLLPGERP